METLVRQHNIWAVYKQHSLFVALILVLVVLAILSPSSAHADGYGDARCVSNLVNAGLGYSPTEIGQTLISNVFDRINELLRQIQQTFYQNIIKTKAFQYSLAAVVMLYLVVYGLLINTSIISLSPNDVVPRILKIALVYALLYYDISGNIDNNTTATVRDYAGNNMDISGFNAWVFFYRYIELPVLNAMNSLIKTFLEIAHTILVDSLHVSSLGWNPNAAHNQVGGHLVGTLDTSSFNFLATSIGTIIGVKFLAVLFILLFAGPMGWFAFIMLLFAGYQFLMMVIGALFSYVRCMVILSFLFGLAPFFIVLLLFDKTRPTLYGWRTQVVAYALEPVMLFAFLAFFINLVNAALLSMIPPTLDVCPYPWLKFLQVVGVNLYMYRPTAYLWIQ